MPSKKKSILVIEDDNSIRKLLKIILEQEKYEVIEIDCGAKFLEYLRYENDPPKLVLLDLRLPDVNGIKILKLIKSNTNWLNVSVIILSGIKYRHDVIQCINEGATDYITKPFNKKELLIKLNRYFRDISEKPATENMVLIIDDEEDFIKTLKFTLENKNYTVIEASSASMALETLGNIKPDLIIADLSMPNMDGYGLIKQLKEDVHTRKIPLIVLSGNKSIESKIKAFKLGIDDFIDKPFHPDELIYRIEAVKRRYHEHNQ